MRSLTAGSRTTRPSTPDGCAAGADRLITVLGEAGDARVWAFGEQRPAGFWARRMTHETTVHGVDAQLTVPGGAGQSGDGDARPPGRPPSPRTSRPTASTNG